MGRFTSPLYAKDDLSQSFPVELRMSSWISASCLQEKYTAIRTSSVRRLGYLVDTRITIYSQISGGAHLVLMIRGLSITCQSTIVEHGGTVKLPL